MGGQLALAHLARGGGDELAAASALCAPVRFALPKSQARLAATAARLLPQGWSVPGRGIQAALSPAVGADLVEALSSDAEGAVVRGLLLHGGEDTDSGLLRQVARWLSTGVLCDRSDRFDYLSALHGCRTPLQVVVAGGDPICPPWAGQPAYEAARLAPRDWVALGDDWGHLDPLVGRRAPAELHPRLLGWLEAHQERCW
jgi:pimeloyl-ACP methyl ester carboxylesterase